MRSKGLLLTIGLVSDRSPDGWWAEKKMSAIGPKRTSLVAPHMSALRGKADMTVCGSPLSRSLLGVKRTCLCALHMSAYDPKRTSTHLPVLVHKMVYWPFQGSDRVGSAWPRIASSADLPRFWPAILPVTATL